MNIFRKKHLLLIITPVIIIFCALFILSHYYPLSLLSINKQYMYTPESTVAAQYETELNDLKRSYEKSETNDLTIIRMQQGLLDVYHQDFLISGDSVVFTNEKFSSIKSDVVETRKILLDLTFSENYDENTKNYLQLLIESLIEMESYIQKAELTTSYSKEELEQVLNKLQMHFYSSLKYFDSFYDSYTNS